MLAVSWLVRALAAVWYCLEVTRQKSSGDALSCPLWFYVKEVLNNLQLWSKVFSSVHFLACFNAPSRRRNLLSRTQGNVRRPAADGERFTCQLLCLNCDTQLAVHNLFLWWDGTGHRQRVFPRRAIVLSADLRTG